MNNLIPFYNAKHLEELKYKTINDLEEVIKLLEKMEWLRKESFTRVGQFEYFKKYKNEILNDLNNKLWFRAILESKVNLFCSKKMIDETLEKIDKNKIEFNTVTVNKVLNDLIANRYVVFNQTIKDVFEDLRLFDFNFETKTKTFIELNNNFEFQLYPNYYSEGLRKINKLLNIFYNLKYDDLSFDNNDFFDDVKANKIEIINDRYYYEFIKDIKIFKNHKIKFKIIDEDILKKINNIVFNN